MLKFVKDSEVVVKANDFGLLVEELVRDSLRPKRNIDANWLDGKLCEWWPKLLEYYQRHIIQDIELAIMLDDPPRPSGPLQHKEMWVRFVKDFRPARSTFTIDYCCGKCKTKNVKLWRGVHGCPDDSGNKLLCATCLAPDDVVDDEGRWQEPPPHSMRTDQVKGWLPAVPVGDTYWGYSSVPSQDIEWWIALPTYTKEK
jgi:hypothetical protein